MDLADVYGYILLVHILLLIVQIAWASSAIWDFMRIKHENESLKLRISQLRDGQRYDANKINKLYQEMGKHTRVYVPLDEDGE